MKKLNWRRIALALCFTGTYLLFAWGIVSLPASALAKIISAMLVLAVLGVIGYTVASYPGWWKD